MWGWAGFLLASICHRNNHIRAETGCELGGGKSWVGWWETGWWPYHPTLKLAMLGPQPVYWVGHLL